MTRPVLVLLLVGAACSRSSSPAPPRFGALMGDVGQRFELAGKAAAASRFELASFEVGEIGEVMAQLPHAEPPREGNAAVLPPMIEEFRKAELPELAKAAKNKDARAFADAFAHAAAQCNACHVASGHGFIEVSSELGKPVPDLAPVTSR